jgi:hypothetical protein
VFGLSVWAVTDVSMFSKRSTISRWSRIGSGAYSSSYSESTMSLLASACLLRTTKASIKSGTKNNCKDAKAKVDYWTSRGCVKYRGGMVDHSRTAERKEELQSLTCYHPSLDKDGNQVIDRHRTLEQNRRNISNCSPPDAVDGARYFANTATTRGNR